MEALFIELPPFERHRAEYLTDDEFRDFQQMLLKNPACGDARRNKGKRGGIRVIYHWYLEKSHFLLFTLYDKDQEDDLTKAQRDSLREMLELAKKRGL
ncbi:type II toxin-antitoxin system RelE/ParE family toxin [Gibbsiella dentisursi]|uniref:Type II toxin-antitoxin system RelE/ParE family toxin n=1 Tax=Gibbsiella dentisursi TaxID=796890 RepID=A0ABP7LHV3_9GAMM